MSAFSTLRQGSNDRTWAQSCQPAGDKAALRGYVVGNALVFLNEEAESSIPGSSISP